MASTPSTSAIPNSGSMMAAGVTSRGLMAAATLYFCLGHVLLWAFIGKANPVTLALAGVMIRLVVAGTAGRQWYSDEPRVKWGTVFTCCAAVFVLLILSGEGRLFYANVDWQVRQALLGDMGRNPWPFLYTHGNQDLLLRAPLGMYFVPALVWQWGGERAASFALLAQNTVLIGTLLAALSPALPTRRARWIGLVVFLIFSGLDALGSLGQPLSKWNHLEPWNGGLQFSSTITLLFWVPNHAIAGWAGAAAYLLWLRGLAPARLLLTLTPLVALWSPLAMIGLLPFAGHAGVSLIWFRRVRWRDVAVPALAVMLVFPSIVYLLADASGAPTRLIPIAATAWLRTQALETLPFLFPLWGMALRNRGPGRGTTIVTLGIVSGTLAALPFLQVGQSADMMMRGSIPALAVLTFLVAEELGKPASPYSRWLIAVLAIGAITPLLEIARSLHNPPAPRVDCTMFEAWDIGPDLLGVPMISKGTYLARVDHTPKVVTPARATKVPAYSGKQCWAGEWPNPFAPQTTFEQRRKSMISEV